MTVDSYYCKSCRDDGYSIVFKKEHATRGRSKSPSLAHISESSNKELAALRNVSPPEHEPPTVTPKQTDTSSHADTPMLNKDILLRSEEENNSKNGSSIDSPLGSDKKSAEEIVDDKDPIPNPLSDNEAETTKICSKFPAKNVQPNDPSQDPCKHLAEIESKVKSQEQHINLLECDLKENNKQLKEKDRIIMNKNCKIAELEEANDRCLKTLGLRNEQIRLLSENSASQAEEKLELKAKLYIKENYCKNIENQYFQLKDRIGSTDEEDNDLQQDIQEKTREIEELNESVNQLTHKNVGLLEKIATLEKEISNLRNQPTKKKDESRITLEEEKRELEKIIQKMEEKLSQIDNILHEETEPYQPSHRDGGFSPISDTSLLSDAYSNHASAADRVDETSNRTTNISPRGNDPGRRTPMNNTLRSPRSNTHAPYHNTPTGYTRNKDNPPHRNTPRGESRNSPPYRPISSEREPRHSENPPHRHQLRRAANSRETPTHHDSSRKESSYRDRLLSHKRNDDNYNKDKEADDIQRKKKNIIILGLPETETNRETLDEFIHINRRVLGNNYFKKWDVHHIGRVGEPSDDKPRPVKIELYDITCKIDIMRNAYHLKDDPTYGNISIMHDLTSQQLKELNRLKQLARTQQQEDPDNNYRVRGKPGQWTIKKLSKN